MKKYSSDTEMLIDGVCIGSKAWQTEADKMSNDSEMLQDYIKHIEQQSHGCKTHA